MTPDRLLLCVLFLAAPLGHAQEIVVLDGRIEPLRPATAAIEVDGRVTEVAVVCGDSVEAGQVLVRLDPAPFEFAVQRARATSEGREVEVRAARAELVFGTSERERSRAGVREAEQHLERIRSLAGRGMASRAEVDRAEAAVGEARTALERAEADRERHDLMLARTQAALEVARADLAMAELRLERTRIVAPIAGIVLEVGCEAGEFVAAGRTAIRVYDPGSLAVRAAGADERLGALRPGHRVEIEIGRSGRRLAGAIERIGPAATDPGAIPVLVRILPAEDEDGERLLPGLAARVHIRLPD